MSGYLFDTSILIWPLQGVTPPPTVVRLLGDGAPLYYSPLSVAELSIKFAKGKLKLSARAARNIFDAVSDVARAAGLVELPLRTEHAVQLATLPRHHDDPFDRLLICQALTEGLTLVSSDGRFPLYTELKLLSYVRP